MVVTMWKNNLRDGLYCKIIFMYQEKNLIKQYVLNFWRQLVDVHVTSLFVQF